MAKSWNGVGAAGFATTTTSDLFFHTGGCTLYSMTNDVRTQFEVNHTFDIDLARVYLSANARNNTNPGYVRKNTADTSCSWSLTTTTTGWFDSTGTASFVAGDTVNLRQRMNLGSGSITFNTLTYRIDNGNGNYPVNWYQTSNSLEFAFSTNTTYFMNFSGQSNAVSSGSETRQQLRVRAAGVYSKMQAFVRVNSATQAITIKFRKNGADGNQTVSITSATTGFFEDASNTDSVADGDLINARATSPAGSGSATFTMFGIAFEATVDAYDIVATNNNSRSRTTSTATEYGHIAGSGVLGATEANVEHKLPVPFDASHFRVYVDSAPTVGDTTFTLRKNGADTALTVTTITSTTGWYEDTSNVVSFAVDDLICYKVSASVSSTVTWYAVAIKCSLNDGSGGAGGGGGGGARRSIVVN